MSRLDKSKLFSKTGKRSLLGVELGIICTGHCAKHSTHPSPLSLIQVKSFESDALPRSEIRIIANSELRSRDGPLVDGLFAVRLALSTLVLH